MMPSSSDKSYQFVEFLKYSVMFFQRIDVMGKLVDDLIIKTQEYLQPNPGMSNRPLNTERFSPPNEDCILQNAIFLVL